MVASSWSPPSAVSSSPSQFRLVLLFSRECPNGALPNQAIHLTRLTSSHSDPTRPISRSRLQLVLRKTCNNTVNSWSHSPFPAAPACYRIFRDSASGGRGRRSYVLWGSSIFRLQLKRQEIARKPKWSFERKPEFVRFNALHMCCPKIGRKPR